jgi:imidazolonepropionase-like amidohydrolase
MRDETNGRGPVRWIAAAGLLLFALLSPSSPAGAEDPERPAYYAIRDARVVVGTGQIFEQATVLIADGRIEAVGTGIDIPGDAWVIDGAGLSVYPGLLDTVTAVGLGRGDEGGMASMASSSSGERGAIRETPGPEARPRTHAERDAAEMLAEDADFALWREAGFTAGFLAPEEGIFPGQLALVHFLEGGGDERVVASGLAQRIEIEEPRGAAGRNFPGSLMGVLSYIEQTLLDAAHAEAAAARYRKDPRRAERPAYDPALEPLSRALAGKIPFVISADDPHELDRALALASRHGLSGVAYGARGAYARAAELAAEKMPAVVSLDWPEAESARDPEADTPFTELYHRRLAPHTPARLAAAKVPFAFSSGTLSSPDKVFAGVRKAVEAGLSEADALAALTLGPAKIFGLEGSLGSVERGKIANLVLATAAPWAEDTELRAVFVNGRYFPNREGEEEEEETEPPALDVGGTWALTVEAPNGSREQTLELKMAPDGKVSGDLRSERGDVAVSKGRLSGSVLTFEVTRTMGPRTLEVSYRLEAAEEELTGTASAGPMRFDVRGERTAAAVAAEEGGEEVPIEELEAVMARYRGKVREMGSFAITNARVYTPEEVIEGGTVLVRDGVIRAVGAEVEIPSGVETIDAGGGSLIPGIIDAHSHIAIDGSGNEGTVAVSAMVTTDDVIEAEDIAIYRALAGGVTTVNVLHGSANPIGGGNAVLKLRWGGEAADLRFEGAPPGIKFALGENPKGSRRANLPGARRYPATRMGVMDVVRQAFTEADAYRDAWREYREKGSKSGVLPPRRDLKLERLAEVLDGTRLVHAHSYRADEILQLLRLAEELGFKITTLQHVLEGYKVADEIAAHGAGGSTFSDWWGYKVEAYDAIPHNAAILHERGVVVSINSDSAEEMRHLNQEAAKTMKWGGLSELEALALVTSNPAQQLGIDGSVGSIEVGKHADLVLYDGPPLAITSVVQKTFIDGDLYFDLEADRERQAQLDAIKARLMPAAKEDGEKEEDAEEEASEEAAPESIGHGTYSCREEV